MKSNLESPKKSLYELVKHVLNSQNALEGITYKELARRIGRMNKHGEGHGHGMGKVLGKMGQYLENLKGEWGEEIPYIQSLVVNTGGSLKGLPDDGIVEFWKGYPELSYKEKLNKVRTEYNRVIEFGSRWNKVLADLGVEPITFDTVERPHHINRTFNYNGESSEHKALKNFVCNHPELVGAEASDKRFTEYSFPSLDTVDVLFKSSSQWIAVEVKSRISDNIQNDYERGVYQCVKYRALMEAMKKDPEQLPVPEKIQVVLLLEKNLPQKYKPIAEKMGIKVIERICVPKDHS